MLRFVAYIGLFLIVAVPINFYLIWFGHVARPEITFKSSLGLAVNSGTLLISTIILITEIVFASKNKRVAPIKGLDSIFYLALLLFFLLTILLFPIDATFGNGQVYFGFTNVTLWCQMALFLFTLSVAIFINYFVHKEQS